MSTRTMRARAVCAMLGLTLAGAASALAGDLRAELFQKQSDGVRQLRAGAARAAADLLCFVMERALNSHDPAWYCGQARLALRDPAGAIEALEIAVDIDPQHLATWVDLGDAYIGAGKLERARVAFYRALELRKDYAPGFDGLARVAAATGKDDVAIEQFTKAVEANPADGQVLLHRGQFHLRRGRFDQALDDIRSAAKLRPDDATVQLGLAEVLMQTGLFEDSLVATRRAKQLRPRDPLPMALEAELFRRMDALVEAIDGARAALALDPDLFEARLTLGSALGARGQLSEAIAVLQPPNPELLGEQQRATLERERVSWQARRDQLQQWEADAARSDASIEARLQIAATQLQAGQVAMARSIALQACESAELTEAQTRACGLLLAQSGELLAAERLFLRLVEHQPRDLAAHLNLAISRELSGDPGGAQVAFEAALAIDAEAPAALAGLARLAWARGDRVQMLAALERYQQGQLSAEERARTRMLIERLTRTANLSAR